MSFLKTIVQRVAIQAWRTPVVASHVIGRRSYPVCSVDTNLRDDAVPEDFHRKFSKVIADTLNKTESNISVCLRTGVRICRDSNDEPTASVHIWSLGVFDAERNPGYSKILFDFLVPQLNIPANRITVMFHPIEKWYAGHLLVAEMK